MTSIYISIYINSVYAFVLNCHFALQFKIVFARLFSKYSSDKNFVRRSRQIEFLNIFFVGLWGLRLQLTDYICLHFERKIFVLTFLELDNI